MPYGPLFTIGMLLRRIFSKFRITIWQAVSKTRWEWSQNEIGQSQAIVSVHHLQNLVKATKANWEGIAYLHTEPSSCPWVRGRSLQKRFQPRPTAEEGGKDATQRTYRSFLLRSMEMEPTGVQDRLHEDRVV